MLSPGRATSRSGENLTASTMPFSPRRAHSRSGENLTASRVQLLAQASQLSLRRESQIKFRVLHWKPRKSGYTISTLIWVPPSTSKLYYLRMLLTIVKGPTSYEDIRTISNFQYSTFRDAFFCNGLTYG
ncbi:hypothetical protein Lal_00013489 [Lupinus albus]|nr:hypothetical protein Lal_00013489 [Lupinus albus]